MFNFEISEFLIFLLIFSRIGGINSKSFLFCFCGRDLLPGTWPGEIFSFWFLMVTPRKKTPREKFLPCIETTSHCSSR